MGSVVLNPSSDLLLLTSVSPHSYEARYYSDRYFHSHQIKPLDSKENFHQGEHSVFLKATLPFLAIIAINDSFSIADAKAVSQDSGIELGSGFSAQFWQPLREFEIVDSGTHRSASSSERQPVSLANYTTDITGDTVLQDFAVNDSPVDVVFSQGQGRLSEPVIEQVALERETQSTENTITETQGIVSEASAEAEAADLELTVDNGAEEALLGGPPPAPGSLPELAFTGGDGEPILFDFTTAIESLGLTSVTDIIISNIPPGFTVFPAQDIGNGEFSIAPEDIFDVALFPPTDFSGVVDLIVSVTGLNPSGDTVTDTTTGTFTFEDAADQPFVLVSNAMGLEDALTIPLNITSNVSDTDGSETLSLTISGVPLGVSLNNGLDQGSGVWLLNQGDLSGLTLTPIADSNVDFTLTITATATETNSDTASTVTTLDVNVIGVADAASLTTDDLIGLEDTVIPATILASLNDVDGSETLTVTIENVPLDGTFSAGVNTAPGVWVLSPGDFAGLTFTPGQDSTQDAVLTVTATVTENDGDTTSVIDTVQLDITPVADAPIAEDGTAVLTDGDTVTGQLFALDPDSTIFELDFEIDTLPTNGNLSILADGSYSYQHTGTGPGSGVDSFSFFVFDDTFASDTGTINITIEGTRGDTVANGSANADSLFGGGGNDILTGNAGDDSLQGFSSGDTLDGGAGSDTAIYDASLTGVSIDLDLGTASLGDAAGDTLIDIENLIGSDFADTLIGNGLDNTLLGGDGADVLDGAGGLNDTVSYIGSNAGVTINIDTNTASFGHAAGDTISNFENIRGSSFDDTLTGNAGNNVIDGGGGADIINGLAGDDTLRGFNGNDTVSGGDGNDTYIMGIGDNTDSFDGGAGAAWVDTISVQHVNTAAGGGDWTITTDNPQDLLDATLSENSIQFATNDVDGTITLLDGSETSFTNVERIEF